MACELKQTSGPKWGWVPVTSRLLGDEQSVTPLGYQEIRHRGPVGSGYVRVLVTNDDGVTAPGIAALTRALVGWSDASAAAGGPRHEIVVMAPSTNYSGAGAAVGSVEDHTTIAWQRATIDGAEGVEAYGLDASPALSVIIGAMGAVGPKPDLVLSGINHGVNVGRSILHSGTVGAALTASQLGMSALAVSLRAGETPDPWESAADLAVALIPLLVSAPVRTVLNLNVPALPMEKILGLRWARVSGQGLIKAASGTTIWQAPNPPEMEGPAAAEGSRAVMERTTAEATEDAALVGQGYAALTALRGPRVDEDPELFRLLDAGLAGSLAPLGLTA
jgi:5'-nucleotidase